MDSGPLFTININPTGYSDQLNQFMLLYGIGKKLGLAYVYTDIAKTYERFNENSRKFIGVIFEGESKSVNTGEFENKPLIINAQDFVDNNIRTGQEAITYLKEKIRCLGVIDTIFVLELYGDRNPLWAFLQEFDGDINAPLRGAMNGQINQYPIDTLYPFDAKIKVFIHLRFGDVTRLATPWPYDFNLWHSERLGALCVSTPESMRILRVCIRELTEEYGEEQICFSIHSDNFELAEHDYSMLMKDSLVVTKEQISICRHLLTEMSSELELFNQFSNAKVFINKDPRGVEKLTAALVNSDLAISNGMQRMIAKLIGIFSIGKPLALAALMEDSEDKEFHTLVLPPRDAVNFIPLEYKSFSLEPVKHFINEQVLELDKPWCYPISVINREMLSGYCVADLYKAGCALQASGHLDGAIHCFNRALELSNADDRPLGKKIEVLRAQGDIDQTNKLVDQRISKAEAIHLAKQNYISTKISMGEKEGAKKINEKGAEKSLAQNRCRGWLSRWWILLESRDQS